MKQAIVLLLHGQTDVCCRSAGKSVVFLRECCGDADFKAVVGHEALWSADASAFLEVQAN